MEDEGLHPYLGFNQGFDEYQYGYPLDSQKLSGIIDQNHKNKLFLFLQLDDVHRWNSNLFSEQEFNITKINEVYMEYIKNYEYIESQLVTQPTLYWCNYVAGKILFENLTTNSPYKSYKEYFNFRYDSGVSRVDSRIGTLVDLFREKGILKNSIIIITADHGEELEHEFTHGTFKEEVYKIPLIVIYSNKRFHGERKYDYVTNMDIFPTLIKIIGIKDKLIFLGQNFLKSDFKRNYLVNDDYIVYNGSFFTRNYLIKNRGPAFLLNKFKEYEELIKILFKGQTYDPVPIPYPDEILLQFRRYNNTVHQADDKFKADTQIFNLYITQGKIQSKFRIKEMQTASPLKEKEKNAALLKSYFLPSPTPYPDMITHLIECPNETNIAEIEFYNTSAFTYYLNLNFNPTCIKNDIKYKALRFYSYSAGNLLMYEIISYPATFDVNQITKYFSFLRNSII